MRFLLPLSFLIFCISCAGSRHTTSNITMLNGTWIPVQEEMGGKQLPSAVYASQKLIMNDSNYTVVAESIDKGIVRMNGNKMDIYGRDGVNTGKHFTALYKCEKDQLTICYNLKGDSYPETFETMGKPLFFLSVFTKEAKK